MSLVLIGPAEREAIADLQRRAAARPCDVAALRQILASHDVAGWGAHAAQMESQTITLPPGLEVCYGTEINHPDGQTGIHLCMHWPRRQHHPPTPHEVWFVAEAFGFTGSLRDCFMWIDQLPGGIEAVNVVQMIEPATVH